MAAERHSPAAASLLAVEIEGNAILKWAGWRMSRRKGGGGIEDVKKTMASTFTTQCFLLEMGAKNNNKLFFYY